MNDEARMTNENRHASNSRQKPERAQSAEPPNSDLGIHWSFVIGHSSFTPNGLATSSRQGPRRGVDSYEEGGLLCAVLQLPTEGLEPVSKSPFLESIQRIVPIMRLVPPDEFTRLARNAGFVEERSWVETLNSGKKFSICLYRL